MSNDECLINDGMSNIECRDTVFRSPYSVLRTLYPVLRATFGSRYSIFAISCLVLAAGGPSIAAENWPQFRGPQGDGHADAADPPVSFGESQNVRWKTAIHDRGWASPVVWGNQVWVATATADGKQMFVVAVDRDSGRVVHDIKLFDVEQPQEINPLNSYASPTPAIEEGRVYAHFGSYGTACVDTRTGQKIWERRDLPCNHFRGPGSSPILYQNLLIVHFDGFDYQYAVALDRVTGQTVWKTDRDIDFRTSDGDFKKAYCTPIVIEAAGRRQLISPCSKGVVSLDPLTGQEFWQMEFEPFSSAAMPLFGKGLLFLNTGFGKADLLAVRPDGTGNVSDTHVVWKTSKGIGSKPSAVLVDDLIFQVHDGGVASCIDAQTGAEVWNKRLGREYSASTLAAAGRVYFFSQEGKITVVKAGRTYEELADNQLDEGFMASPAVTGNALILRTKTHLYRVEK